MNPTCRASRDERTRPLPGDELVPRPLAAWTHAVTIHSRPEEVWPWLAQLGADRAGWYSFDFLDNGGRPSARTILPRFQRIAPGDVLPAVPGATDAFVVADVRPPHLLILTGPSNERPQIVSWVFVLKLLERGRTRLLVRARTSEGWRDFARAASSPGGPTRIDRIYRVLARLPAPLLVATAGFGHWVMESKMLRQIKRHAEGG